MVWVAWWSSTFYVANSKGELIAGLRRVEFEDWGRDIDWAEKAGRSEEAKENREFQATTANLTDEELIEELTARGDFFMDEASPLHGD